MSKIRTAASSDNSTVYHRNHLEHLQPQVISVILTQIVLLFARYCLKKIFLLQHEVESETKEASLSLSDCWTPHQLTAHNLHVINNIQRSIQIYFNVYYIKSSLYINYQHDK